MFNSIQGMATVLGRLLLVTIFLMSAVGNKIPNFSGTVQYMQAAGVPFKQFMLVGAIAFLILGSLSVLIGFKARFGAGLLLVFLVLATYYFHAFWNFEGQDQQMQMIQFMKNLSMAGAMLFLMANGPGPVSIDNRTVKRTASRLGETSANAELQRVLN